MNHLRTNYYVEKSNFLRNLVWISLIQNGQNGYPFLKKMYKFHNMNTKYVL
jgi:hypothetical protein